MALSSTEWLDCFDFRDECIASMVNDSRACFDFSRFQKARSCASLKIDRKNKKASLILTEAVFPGQEIVTYYSKSIQIVMPPAGALVDCSRWTQAVNTGRGSFGSDLVEAPTGYYLFKLKTREILDGWHVPQS